MAGERGMTGDHGQDGRQGVDGPAGLTGEQGEEGVRGRDAFTRKQTAVIAAFILFAFMVLAFRAEHNATNIRENQTRITEFVDETCARHPEFAPGTCEGKR
jgi:hypothetical protein